ncbi:MAG: exodeoxyribonuclease V subunit alpha [Sandaracinaceae bacterium]|nr:MAG: exodeoxyribonuclease V subunit alpha [Sandaracinaceae bacterium]
MTLGWSAHGAARVRGGFGADPRLPDALPDIMREQIARSEIAEEDAHLAWELARLAALPDPEDHLALLCVLLVALETLARGSTRVALSGIGPRARALLGASPDVIARIDALLDAPPTLFGPPELRRPLVIEDGHLYLERVRAVEERLAERIRTRGGATLGAVDPDAALAMLRERPAHGARGPMVLTDEQEAAVATALRAPFTVISGGPGTGKTSIVVAILRAALSQLALDSSAIALAAPTGKAADRMRRAIEGGLRAVAEPSDGDLALLDALPEPKTLHRLLGWSPSRGAFRHHMGNPLSERLVVVDESSMIDVFLMERLVESLHPQARLVLLGDAEQLPSVAAGAVFRDLGGAAPIASVHLEKSHRMDPTQPEGFNVLHVARALNAGSVPALAPLEGGLPSRPDALGQLEALPPRLEALGGVSLFEPRTTLDREALLDAWYAERVRGPSKMRQRATQTWRHDAGRLLDPEGLAPLFAFMERARLLCVTRSAARPTGVEAINESLHRRFTADARASVGAALLLAGEPVLVHRNDYERGLFNGDQGMVLFTAEEGESPRPSAVFRREDGFVAHPIEAVRGAIELGYATTVHKAQGSEHDAVCLLLPDTDSPRLLTREIVYTAVTRARRSVLIVGARDLLQRAAARRIERSTGMIDRLR